MTAMQPDKELPLSSTNHDENPLHTAAFWKPRFAVDGDMLRFAPFLFWLAALLRPSHATVIGLGDGVACLALCQAMDRLQVDGICTGIHFSSDTVPDMPDLIEEHATQFYEGLVHLKQSEGPTEALSCLTPNRHDLLVIDLQLSDDWPQDALDDWRSRLSPRGCLVLHGLTQMPQATSSSLSRQMAHLSCFSINIGAGLSVLCNDPNPTAELACAISRGRLPRQASAIFARLGQGLIADVRYDRLTSRLARQENALIAARHRAETLQTELTKVSALLELRGLKASEYQALYYDCDAALKMLRRAEAKTLDAQAEQLAKDAALAARDTLATQLRQNRETHYRETAKLTLLLEEQRKSASEEVAALRQQAAALVSDNEALLEEQRKSASEEVAALRQQATALVRDNKALLEEQRKSASEEVAALRQQAAALVSDNEALLSSTSWKITSPLRRIAAKVSGQPRPR